MTNRDNLTDADWAHLQRTVEAVTDAVMVAHPGGTLSEVFAVYQGWAEASDMFSGNPFVQELLSTSPEEVREWNEQVTAETDESAETIAADAVVKCQEAIAILREKDPDDLETYQRVVLFLGDKVARAAVEGGFLGIGGKRVSDEESAVLDRIATALEFAA